jgi:hypothetical protein
MAITEAEHQRVRGIAGDLARRVAGDQSYRAQIEQDPVTTLRDAGLPDAAIADILREVGGGGTDVEGYVLQLGAPLAATNCDYTCLWTCGWTDTVKQAGGPTIGNAGGLR